MLQKTIKRNDFGPTATAVATRDFDQRVISHKINPSVEKSLSKKRSTPEPVLPRIAAGEQDAVEECLKRYSGLIWSLARKMLSNREEAEDAVQEIFVEIWKNAGRYDAKFASETTFVAMLARRRLIDRVRKISRQPHVDSFDDMPVEPVKSKGKYLQTSIEAKQAAEAINELKPEQRKILQLSIVEGYSHSEIAEALSMPLGTVKTHARRGLIKVRETISKQESAREVSA